MWKRWAIASLWSIALACSDQGPEQRRAPLDGLWLGEAAGGSLWTLELEQQELDRVEGDGIVSGAPFGSCSFIVATGEFDPPLLELTLVCGNRFMDLSLALNTAGDVLSGSLNGSGFNNVAVEFEKVSPP